MPAKALNRRFFLLQAIMMLIDCITVAYISPILVSFGYSKLQIGQVMTLGALAATLARPLWGFLNDRFSCAKQVTLGGTAVGIDRDRMLRLVNFSKSVGACCGLISPSDTGQPDALHLLDAGEDALQSLEFLLALQTLAAELSAARGIDPYRTLRTGEGEDGEKPEGVHASGTNELYPGGTGRR